MRADLLPTQERLLRKSRLAGRKPLSAGLLQAAEPLHGREMHMPERSVQLQRHRMLLPHQAEVRTMSRDRGC